MIGSTVILDKSELSTYVVIALNIQSIKGVSRDRPPIILADQYPTIPVRNICLNNLSDGGILFKSFK